MPDQLRLINPWLSPGKGQGQKITSQGETRDSGPLEDLLGESGIGGIQVSDPSQLPDFVQSAITGLGAK